MSDSPSASGPGDSDRAGAPTSQPIVETGFVLEVVERANDRLLDRIDALDAFFGVLMTAVLAVVLLALDRFRLFGPFPDVPLGWTAISLLILAFFGAIAGWLRGNDVLLRKLFRYGKEEERDAPIPRRFIWAVGAKGEQALLDTISAISLSFTANQPIRTYKRHLAAISLALLTLGTLAAGLAKVIYLSHVTTSESGHEGLGQRDRARGRYSCKPIGSPGFLYLRPPKWRTRHCIRRP